MIQLRLGAWMVTLIAPIFPRVTRAVRHLLCKRPHLCCWLLFGSVSGVLLTGRLRVLLGISRSSHRRASRCNKASTFPQFGQGNVTYARINVSVFYFCPVLATLAPLFFSSPSTRSTEPGRVATPVHSCNSFHPNTIIEESSFTSTCHAVVALLLSRPCESLPSFLCLYLTFADCICFHRLSLLTSGSLTRVSTPLQHSDPNTQLYLPLSPPPPSSEKLNSPPDNSPLNFAGSLRSLALP
jgi:hypothetical protein